MAKFPTTVQKSITVRAPLEKVYQFLWNAVASSECIAGIDRCEQVAPDTYRFVLQPKSVGPVSLAVQYTVKYEGNGTDTIRYQSIAAEGDNTDVEGRVRLRDGGDGSTRIQFEQMTAPETPVPRLLQGMLKSFVAGEAEGTIREFLANVKRRLESA